MRSTTPKDQAAALGMGALIVAGLAHLAAKGIPGPVGIGSTPIRSDLPPLAAGIVLAAVLVASLRFVFTRRALAHRVQLELLPADDFDPPLESIRRFASQLAHARRGFLTGWLERPGSAIRVLLAPDEQGVLGYRLEVPARARRSLEAALTAYSGWTSEDASRCR